MRFSRTKPIVRRVSVNGFHRIRSPGDWAGAGGTPRLTAHPATASAIRQVETIVGPHPCTATSTPPASVPSRMATKVAISTSAFPPISSSSRRCCGRMLYLTGPKTVE